MMHRRRRARRLLRGLAKLAAVVAVAAGVGTGVGFGISALTTGEPTPARTAAQRSTASTPASRPSASTTTRAPGNALEPIRLTVVSGVLHPAATAADRQRQRARVGVWVTVRNRSARTVALARPSLLAARQRIPTNPRADTPRTHLASIGAGRTVNVALQFETVGAVTQQLQTQRRGRILLAGRSRPVWITVGSPARTSTRSDATPR
jgi:hypothetical protein